MNGKVSDILRSIQQYSSDEESIDKVTHATSNNLIRMSAALFLAIIFIHHLAFDPIHLMRNLNLVKNAHNLKIPEYTVSQEPNEPVMTAKIETMSIAYVLLLETLKCRGPEKKLGTVKDAQACANLVSANNGTYFNFAVKEGRHVDKGACTMKLENHSDRCHEGLIMRPYNKNWNFYKIGSKNSWQNPPLSKKNGKIIRFIIVVKWQVRLVSRYYQFWLGPEDTRFHYKMVNQTEYEIFKDHPLCGKHLQECKKKYKGKEWKKRGWIVLSSTGDCVLFLECQNAPTGSRANGFKEIHWKPTELEYIGSRELYAGIPRATALQ